jgi:hypothetical protein
LSGRISGVAGWNAFSAEAFVSTGNVRKSRTTWAITFPLVAAYASAESFSHRQGAEHFEVTVSAERVVVKERYQGTTTIYGDLSCPLGPAVRAAILEGADGRLCFTFAARQCEYTRFQNGSAVHTEELANARVPRMCIVLASRDEAHRLAKLVNMGPQQAKTAESGSTEEAKLSAPSAGRPKRAEAPEHARATAPPSGRSTEPASGSTRSAAERVHRYSSDERGGTRGEVDRQQAATGVPLALFVHVRNPGQRAEVERLIEPLSARGIRVTGIKLMDAGPADTDLRYFHWEDARQAGEVVRALRSVGLPLPRIKHIKGLESRATPQQYELWLSPTDRPGNSSAERNTTAAARQRM